MKALVFHDIVLPSGASWKAGEILSVASLSDIQPGEYPDAKPETHICLKLRDGRRLVLDAGKIHLLLPGAVPHYELQVWYFGSEAEADHYADGKLVLAQKLTFTRWRNRKILRTLTLAHVQTALRELRSQT